MAMLSNAQRTTAPLSSGTVWPVLRQKARIASGMSPGATKSAASGLMNDRSGGRGGAKLVERLPIEVRAGMVPHAAAFLHQPQPGDVLQQAGRAADAAFVGEVQLQHRIVDHRLRRLDAQQRPGAEADVAPVGPHAGPAVGGHGHHRAGRVVRAGQHHLGRRQARTRPPRSAAAGPASCPAG